MMNMTPIDHNYLRIQFWLKIHEKSGSEFQSFFESIAEKTIAGFQKIRPYGNQGDGGNDGYVQNEGAYYQAYAPSSPQEKDTEAAKKMKADFAKLQGSGWGQISNIKKYSFVFNDKGNGISIEIEKALAELRNTNPNIEFTLLLPKDLEGLFFSLNQADTLSLGFDINATKAVAMAYDLLNKLEVEIDRDNGKNVLKGLENLSTIISGLNDEGVTLLYELLEARALQNVEKIIEAKSKLESLVIKYPRDPRACLYLAEHYLNNEDFEQNKELLDQAEAIDATHWLLDFEKLVRTYRMGETIELSKIAESSFPADFRARSNFYRIHALFYDRANDYPMTDSFIAKAISANPEKFNNYNAKISLLISRAHREKDREAALEQLKNVLKEFDILDQKILEWGGLSDRNKVALNVKKMHVYVAIDSPNEVERLAPETFELLLGCYFNATIDELVVELLTPVSLPDKDFERLLEYLKKAENQYSSDLGNILFVQFLYRKNLFAGGITFFTETKHQDMIDLINHIQNNNHEEVLSYLKDRIRFAVGLANTLKDYPELRKKIIESLPTDGTIQKEKLLLLLNYDENQIDDAFTIIQQMDLSHLGYFECRPILQVAKRKEAWDFVVVILQRLMVFEQNKEALLQLNLDLFNAYLHLEKFPELISLGEKILDEEKDRTLLEDQAWEWLLGQTANACIKRSEQSRALLLIEKYKDLSKTFECKAFVEAPVYIGNKDANKALASIAEGAKVLKNPSPEQYGRLFWAFHEISNLIDFNLTSFQEVVDGYFIKLRDQERWFYMGDGDELDATKLASSDSRYTQLLGKKAGDKIAFEDKYRSSSPEYTIESIFPIEHYIHWQCVYHFNKLTVENRWDVAKSIEVPTTGDASDFRFVTAFLEDEHKKRADFFEMYCKDNLPFAMLAVNEGGATNALGTITAENRGYVKFSTGALSEINEQKKVSEGMINGDPFYIDGMSALILSETGLLEQIYKHLPNIKIPQSVISFLLEVKDRFVYKSGQNGSLGYAQGRLRYSSIDEETRKKIERNFDRSIQLLESKPENLIVISKANKHDGFMEQRVPDELCDACILAQRDGAALLTEDLYYLQANALETKKESPRYASAFSLVRVLYEQKKISFEQYINFFSYLAGYRFKFLPISTDELIKAVFGDGDFSEVKPERLRQLHLGLVLSEDYGVPFTTAGSVVFPFVLRILMDDAVLPDIAERIFTEILTLFPAPKNMDGKTIGRAFIRVCVQALNDPRRVMVAGRNTQGKIDRLMRLTELFGGNSLLFPR